MYIGLYPTKDINQIIFHKRSNQSFLFFFFPPGPRFSWCIWVKFFSSRSVCRSSFPSKKPNLAAPGHSHSLYLFPELDCGELPTFLSSSGYSGEFKRT